ncbi:hypothetical protein D9M68_593210 [compost metagenome]
MKTIAPGFSGVKASTIVGLAAIVFKFLKSFANLASTKTICFLPALAKALYCEIKVFEVSNFTEASLLLWSNVNCSLLLPNIKIFSAAIVCPSMVTCAEDGVN